MNATTSIVAAVVAAAVSLITTIATLSVTSRNNSLQLLQVQYKEIIQKRIEYYPKLWAICTRYQAHWADEQKTREWAVTFLAEIKEFNLEGGVFFSQGLYSQFEILRELLTKAVDRTERFDQVEREIVDGMAEILYGRSGPGLGTILKDDLGSYRSPAIQRRRD